MTDDDNPAAAPTEDATAWERAGEGDGSSMMVRPPALAPTPRSAPAHAGHMKLLFENAPVAMAMFDTDMRYLLANRRWLDDFKLTGIEVAGRSHYELFPALHPGWRHVYERALTGQIVRSDRDAITQDGRPVVYRWEVRPWRHVDTTVGGVMISCERLFAPAGAQGIASEKLEQPPGGESLWQSALPLLAMNAEGRIARASKGAAGLLRAGTAGGGSLPFWQAFGSAENLEVLRKHVLASLHSVLADSRAFSVIFTGPAKEDSAAPSQWLVSRLESSSQGTAGDLALVIGLPGMSPFSPEMQGETDRDNAELRQLTEQLSRLQSAVKESADATGVARQRETRLRAVLDLAPCGLMVLDDHARPIYHNAHVDQLLGRELKDGCGVEEWLAEGARDDLHHTEITRRWTEGVWRKNLALPIALTAADGLLKEIEMRPVSLPGGGLLVMMQDVTESRRGEEMLRSTEAKYRALVQESPVPIILADRSAAVFDVNPAAEAFLGHTRTDLRRMSVDSWLDPESLEVRNTTLAEMQKHGERSGTMHARVLHRGGETSLTEIRLALVMDAGGQVLFTVHFFVPVQQHASVAPVTEAPAPVTPSAETSLPIPASHTQTQALLLLSTDIHGRIVEWSEDAAERFGYDADEISRRGLHVLFRPSDATGFYADLLALSTSAAGEAIPVEWTFFHKTEGRQQGPFFIQKDEDSGLSVSLLEEVTVFSPAPAAAPGDVQIGTEAAASSESRTSSEPLRPPAPVKPTAEELSRERLLLGEAHHRVKNHLQIITSMLNLQMSTLHNDEARDALRSSQNRVRSIAALHQHLFQLATGEGADFKTFATGLIAHLRECYQVPEDRVSLQLDVPDRPVPEEWLMPLSLSLNEMVSNAFKHAYPDRRGGAMRVTLTWNDEEGELTVMDDGAGLPAGFTHHDSTGLGLKILRVFAGQIGGEVHIHSDPGEGAVFQLKFPVASTSDEPKPDAEPQPESNSANKNPAAAEA